MSREQGVPQFAAGLKSGWDWRGNNRLFGDRHEVLYGANTVTYPGPMRLLRFARNDDFRACRCEERSDEAISRSEGFVTVFANLSAK
ncbi:MAG: hypothetical protein AB1649_30645 [Chloroflexota bacterium]